MVVNSGGEKIFVEEVEEAVRRHPDVVDAVVVGRPSERFGQEVVALVQLRDGTTRRLRTCAGSSGTRSRASRRRGRCCSANASAAIRRARPTTAGRAKPPSTRSRSPTSRGLPLRRRAARAARRRAGAFSADHFASRRRRRQRGPAGGPGRGGRWRTWASSGCCRPGEPAAPSTPPSCFEQLGAHLGTGPLLWSTLADAVRHGAADGAVRVTGVEIATVERPLVIEHARESDVCRRARRPRRSGARRSPGALAGEPFDPLTPPSLVDELPAARSWRGRGGGRGAWLGGTVLAAAQLVGVAQGALDVARGYALNGAQFGVPIGSFQAVKHLLADMYVRVTWPAAPPTRPRPSSTTPGPATSPARRPRRSCSPASRGLATAGPQCRCSAAWGSPGRCCRTTSSSGRGCSSTRSAPAPSTRTPSPAPSPSRSHNHVRLHNE